MVERGGGSERVMEVLVGSIARWSHLEGGAL